MAYTVTAHLPTPSARTVERSLAVLLVVLLTTYALGTVANGVVPAVHTAGVIAVHLAVVIGFLFPVVVLGHATVSQIRTGESPPSRVEIGIAVGAAVCLTVALLAPTKPHADVLLGIAAGGSLLLAGLVFAR